MEDKTTDWSNLHKGMVFISVLKDWPATNSLHITVVLGSRIKQLLPLLESILSSSLLDHLIGWSLANKNDHVHHSIPIFEHKT